MLLNKLMNKLMKKLMRKLKKADEQAKNIENADSTSKLKIVPIVSIVFKTSASKDQASPNDRFGVKHVL